jgi:hypothetical protein
VERQRRGHEAGRASAAPAFLAGQNDAAMTYEPYLSSVRDKPDAGKIIATTLDYPVVMDTFGCTPKFINEHGKLVQAMTIWRVFGGFATRSASSRFARPKWERERRLRRDVS